jgi:sugar phosphate isomerase/epimerase
MAQTRREWLTGTAGGLAGLGLVGQVKHAMAAGGADWVKVGMCDWSMGRTNPSAFDRGKKIGLDGIEVSIGSVQNDLWLRQPEMQKKYLAAAKRHGMSIPSLAMGLLNGVPLMSEPRTALWVADTIDVAKALGARVVLLAFFGRGTLREDSKDDMRRVTEVLQELAPRAEKAGVILGLENLVSAEGNLKIIEATKSKYVQVYYDVFNAAGKGYDVIKEIKLLGKAQICQVHFKEGPKFLGSGKIDWPAVAAALQEINYRGWLVLETSSPSRDIVADSRKNLQYLRKLFSA